jgi:hypothetical protein
MPESRIPTPDLDDPKEIYAFAGLALYQANLVEASLINLGAVLCLDGVKVITQELFVEIFQNLEAKTLGQILKATRSLTTVSSEVDSVLSKMLEERNFLTHKFFREYAGDMLNDRGLGLMIERLRTMIKLFQHADSLVTPIYTPLWEKYGVNESFIQRELAEMRAKIEAKYSKP